MLETVAAVPGMVGATIDHLRCLRRMCDDKGWIRTLMDEAENERMHLMTFIEISRPNCSSALVLVAQASGSSTSPSSLLYLSLLATAHRVVGYFEEQAVISYTQYLEQIDAGKVENVPAPKIAQATTGGLPATRACATSSSRCAPTRPQHRDVNHGFAEQLRPASRHQLQHA